ncbi:hypothetical protein [Clostridium perfringens]|uniref:hypothetical protein n=1 Tax=Clostridium perfringens TaxID=1502 RepID=UPI00399C72E4
MNKKRFRPILVASLTINTIVPNLSVLAKTTNINKIIQDSQKTQEINKVEVSKFETYYSQYKEAYDKNLKWIIPI